MRILLGLAVATPAIAHGACPASRATTADLVAALDEVQLAYTDVEPDVFRTAADRARAVLPCLTDPVGPHVAAELHRTEGLAAFVDRDTERMRLAFAAARSLEPSSVFPTAVVPEGHPVATSYAEARSSGEVLPVAPPVVGHLAFDGSESTERPLDRTTLVQLFDDQGRVLETAYLWPDDPLPAYDPATPGFVESEQDVKSHRARGWWIGAGASALAAGVFYGANVAVHHKYEDPDTPPDQLDGLRTANNTLAVASTVSLAGAVGFGVAAVVTGRF